MEIYSVFLGGLIGVAPYLAGWIAVIVLASLMLRRGGGKAERFLVAGASLMLAKTLFGGFSANIRALLQLRLVVERGWDQPSLIPIFTAIDIFIGCIGLAGIICLVYAFWVKFKTTDGREGAR